VPRSYVVEEDNRLPLSSIIVYCHRQIIHTLDIQDIKGTCLSHDVRTKNAGAVAVVEQEANAEKAGVKPNRPMSYEKLRWYAVTENDDAPD